MHHSTGTARSARHSCSALAAAVMAFLSPLLRLSSPSQPARCRGHQRDRFDLEGGLLDCWRPPRLCTSKRSLVRTPPAARDLRKRLRCGSQGGLGGCKAGAPVESAQVLLRALEEGHTRSTKAAGLSVCAWAFCLNRCVAYGLASSDSCWPACACRDCQGSSTFGPVQQTSPR